MTSQIISSKNSNRVTLFQNRSKSETETIIAKHGIDSKPGHMNALKRYLQQIKLKLSVLELQETQTIHVREMDFFFRQFSRMRRSFFCLTKEHKKTETGQSVER